MSTNDVAAVLALVQSQDVEEAEVELPVPPNDSSEGAQALWYALLGAYEFNLGEMAILEQVVNTKSLMDEVEADWRRDGSPMTAAGSMGQPVTDPRIQELRQHRSQYASLLKALSLPADGGNEKRRPGRPTRFNSGPNSGWGSV
jgi:hypothetical protein